MEHGYAEPRHGRAEGIYGRSPTRSSAFIGDAEMLVTHLAPLSRGDDGPPAGPEIRRRVARRPGQYRHEGGARTRHHSSSIRRAAMPPRSPNSRSARSSPRRGSSRAATMRCARGEWRGDLYRADRDRPRAQRNDGRRHRLWRRSARRVVKLLKAFGCTHSGRRSLCAALAPTIAMTASSRSRSRRCCDRVRCRHAACRA